MGSNPTGSSIFRSKPAQHGASKKVWPNLEYSGKMMVRFHPVEPLQNLGVAEAEKVDAPVCGTGDRGFDFPPSPLNSDER